MANEMDNKRKSRKVLRSSFTRLANELEVLFNVDVPDVDSVKVSWELLKFKRNELDVLDSTVYELMLDSATETELESEMENRDLYMKRFTMLRLRYDKLFADSASVISGKASTDTPIHNTSIGGDTGKRKFKLPTLEFKHYDGSIKDWLGFWAQFKKIHVDESIDNNDKIEYLIQATVPGSKARQLVESYPRMSENYQKIIESMQSRFGREDLQIEVYVRELLKLILTNTASHQKMDISTLYDQIETQLRALETLGITSDKCSAMLFPLIESCLPHDLLRVWQRSTSFVSTDEVVESSNCSLEIRLKKLMVFLRHEVENEQRITLAAEGFGLSEHMTGTKMGPRKWANVPTAAGLINQEVPGCVFCDAPHESNACFKAQKMNLDEKRAVLSKKRACFRCLKVGHQTKKCRERLRCVVCSHSHMTLMCPEISVNKTGNKPNAGSTNEVPQAETAKDQALTNSTSTHVFLQTLRVTLKRNHVTKNVRALIDTGSQRSYILKETATQLGYQPKGTEKVIHCLFGGKELMDTHNCYDVTICSGRYSYTFEVMDQQKICSDVAPVLHGPWVKEMETTDIKVSDFQQHGPIELLLGADVAGSLYTGRRRELPCGLHAIETHVGWTLMGKIPTREKRSNMVMTTLNLFLKNASITDLWELEALGIKEPSDKPTKQETAQAAKELFLQTVSTDQDGRYEVRLPWLEDHPPLPTNHNLSQKRLSSAVRKLKSDCLLEQYDQIFHEWEKEGIIELIGKSDNAEAKQGHYLPHRPVVKESSATTRIRPVYDASAHEKDKPSLNHCLEKGINLIELIPSLLLRFRENKIGVVSDIRKAFLQIAINEKDRDFLRFLWHDGQGQEVIFRHKRVVFGLNSSPFLLGATLEHHLSNCFKRCMETETNYSQDTVERLSRSFYVDNCVTSLSDEDSVTRFIKEAVAVMDEGKFELRGWERTQDNESSEAGDPCHVLGLNWDPAKDILTINKRFLEDDLDTENMVVTKRLILSLTQKVFDPIGFLCPAVLVPKLILQKLWKEQITWDQPVDDDSAQSFRKWAADLHYLSKIEIPRWILTSDSDTQEVSLHTFCDASQDAYACVIYLRVKQQEKVSVLLLAAKARVAPLKRANSKMTIPRLELLAATIGARLFAHVNDNLRRKIDCYFWSDSSTVVSWIRRKEEWGIFVWNRVTEIRDLTSADKWYHLPGIHNPADLPSRGCSTKQLLRSRWWEGPKWLYEESNTWPSTSTTYDEEEIMSERKKKLVTTLLNVGNSDMWRLDYFSKYTKTVRMIAWTLRFIHNCKNLDKRKGELSADEYEVAEKFIFKLVQQESFSGEGAKSISGLSPFHDDDGLIRLKSRASRREDTEYFCFPVVLPSKHPLVKKLITHVHINSCHVGTQGLQSLLREKFWILGGRRGIRSAISNCAVCKRHEAKPLFVEPPPLPLDRVRDAVAFEITGVDLAGPLYLKDGTKAWICLFTCAIFRAVHLELTTSLSTSSFLQAMRRFVSRRGRPKTIYSDNGTNFVGAENALSMLDWDAISRETSVQRISWKFNPPTAAWWGGFWERLIGVLKRLLRKVLCRSCLDYEHLQTVICECEAVINARPLTYLSEDPNDLVGLTPSMFLRDQVEYGLPDCDAIDSASFCKKVRKIQSLREELRNRFRSEYLGQLKLICDRKADRQIAVGELVMVGDDNSKRLDWLIGRVQEVLPDRDGRIRLVRVKTAKGQLLRPLQRLYPLEGSGVTEFEARVENESTTVDEEEAGADIGEPDTSKTKQKVTRSGRVLKIPLRFRD